MNELMTLDELAQYLRLSKITLYKMSKKGRIPANKVGRQWRYRKEEIDKWMKEGV